MAEETNEDKAEGYHPSIKHENIYIVLPIERKDEEDCKST